MSDPRLDVQYFKTLDDAITRTLAEYQTLHERTLGTLETMAQNLRGDELWPTDVAGPIVMLQRTYNERRERLDAEWRRLLQERLALTQGQTGQQWTAHLELTERIKAEKLPDLLEIEIPPLRRDQTVTVATTREFYEMTIRNLRERVATFAALVALWQSGPTVIWDKIETDGERKEVTPDFHLRDRISSEQPSQHQTAEPMPNAEEATELDQEDFAEEMPSSPTPTKRDPFMEGRHTASSDEIDLREPRARRSTTDSENPRNQGPSRVPSRRPREDAEPQIRPTTPTKRDPFMEGRHTTSSDEIELREPRARPSMSDSPNPRNQVPRAGQSAPKTSPPASDEGSGYITITVPMDGMDIKIELPIEAASDLSPDVLRSMVESALKLQSPPTEEPGAIPNQPPPIIVPAEPMPNAEEATELDQEDFAEEMPSSPVPPPPPIVVPSETGQPTKPSVEPPKPSSAGPALPDKKKAESVPAPAVIEPTHFTAYAPKEVPPETWANLSAYIFRASASGAVENDAQQKFGAQLAEMRQGKATASAEIEAGATITATPRLDGFTFNPDSLSLKFVKPYHRFDFEMMAGRERLNLASNGAITFSMGGVLVGEIPLSVFVGERATIEIGVVQAEPYQKIFCSYSHRDTRVVERVERAYRVLGFDYLRDVTRLRSGQQWNAELMRWIDEAHIFQLFWSAAAAGSPYVEQEWRHALQITRQNFIRPVYWKKPLTAPPSELGQLHFAYDPQIQGAGWWTKVTGLVRGE